MRGEFCGVDVVEGLHHLRRGEVILKELGGRGGFIVELRDVTVALRVVVVRVDDDFPSSGATGTER